MNDEKPWWQNSMTMKMLVTAGLGLIGHVTSKSFSDVEVQHWVDITADVLTLVGILGAAIGRRRTQHTAVAAIAHAAETGEITKV